VRVLQQEVIGWRHLLLWSSIK